MKTILITILLTLSMNAQAIIPAFSMSYEDKVTLAVGNLLDDHVTCFVYYSIAEKGSGNMSGPDQLKITEVKDYMFNMAFLLSEQVDLMEEAIISKIELTVQTQTNEMGNHFKNFSVLINKYGNECGNLAADFESQMLIRMKEQGIK